MEKYMLVLLYDNMQVPKYTRNKIIYFLDGYVQTNSLHYCLYPIMSLEKV